MPERKDESKGKDDLDNFFRDLQKRVAYLESRSSFTKPWNVRRDWAETNLGEEQEKQEE